jgi:hypothetical protein
VAKKKKEHKATKQAVIDTNVGVDKSEMAEDVTMPPPARKRKMSAAAGTTTQSTHEDDEPVEEPAIVASVDVGPDFFGCAVHSVNVSDFHEYQSGKDLKHYFDKEKGYLHGCQCANGCDWPPTTDPSLDKNANHKTVHYCGQCNVDSHDENKLVVVAFPYFICGDCHRAKLGKRVRKQKVRSD